MKNLFKKGIAALTLLISLNFWASGSDPVIKVLDKNEMEIEFILDIVNPNSQILVKDQSGVILYKEKINKNNYSKKFNFEELISGNYIMEIQNDISIEKFPFEVHANKVSFSKDEKTIMYKPFVRRRGTIVSVTKLAMNDENLEIKILDANSNVLYKELLEGRKDLGIRFDIGALPQGEYMLAMKTGGVKFTEYLDVN